MPLSAVTLRKVFSRFATGVTIVTVRDETGIHGLTVNSFTSVSLEPPLILVCIQKDVTSHALFQSGRHFAVNILCNQQRDLSNRFANPLLTSTERYKGVAYQLNEHDVPILKGSLAHLACQVRDQFDAGDHTIFLGAVCAARSSAEKEPLLFYESRYLDC